jgi:hypothetical protein
VLYLKPGTREHFLDCLARDWPELVPEYERLYKRGAYMARADADPVRNRVRGLAKEAGIRDRRGPAARRPKLAEQLSLLPA